MIDGTPPAIPLLLDKQEVLDVLGRMGFEYSKCVSINFGTLGYEVEYLTGELDEFGDGLTRTIGCSYRSHKDES